MTKSNISRAKWRRSAGSIESNSYKTLSTFSSAYRQFFYVTGWGSDEISQFFERIVFLLAGDANIWHEKSIGVICVWHVWVWSGWTVGALIICLRDKRQRRQFVFHWIESIHQTDDANIVVVFFHRRHGPIGTNRLNFTDFQSVHWFDMLDWFAWNIAGGSGMSVRWCGGGCGWM